jgi:hypothetical protein
MECRRENRNGAPILMQPPFHLPRRVFLGSRAEIAEQAETIQVRAL